MAVDRNIFKILAKGSPVRLVANLFQANFTRRFFNTVQGLGCRVEIPNKDGSGCLIIVDGTSDLPMPDGFPNPYTGANTPAALIPYAFRVTYDGVNVDVVEGKLFVFNDEVSYAGVTGTAHGGDKYVRIRLTYSMGTNEYSAATLVIENTETADTDSAVYYTIAELDHTGDGSVSLQRVLGDIYDKRLPDYDTDKAVFQHDGADWGINDCMEYVT